MSAQTQIAEAIVGLLQAPAIVDDRVFRDRLSPIARELPDAIVIRLVSSNGERGFTGASSPVDWVTELAIDVYARVAVDQVPTDVIDPLLQAVYARLSAPPPEGLGVEDLMPDPRIEWDLAEGQTQLACATVQVRVRHRTPAASLAARP